MDGRPSWKEARLRLALLGCFHLRCWRETSLTFSLSLFLKGQGWTRVNARTKLALEAMRYPGACAKMHVFLLNSLSTAATVASVPAMSAGLCWSDFDGWGIQQYQETFLTTIIREGGHYWHRMGRGQDGCQTSGSAQDSPSSRRISWFKTQSCQDFEAPFCV